MAAPLAEQLRPATLDDVIGQPHVTGKTGVIRRMLETGRLTSCIFYGSPGCGKTTVARIIAETSGLPFVWLNATTASVADVKSAVHADTQTLVYLDEIQYFNKRQQQSLLSFVEDGSVILIAATTENPYHGIYKALLSRCLVIEFKPLSTDDIALALTRACDASNIAHGPNVGLTDETLRSLAEHAAGDARRALTMLDALTSACDLTSPDTCETVTPSRLNELLPSTNMGSFDTDGDQHYRYKAALQKSIRGSDADAAVFWLNQMLEGGDITSPSRRMLVMASEDVGLADPMAVPIVLSCCLAAERLGLPEARYPLTQAAIYLATAPKSNSIGKAFGTATEAIHRGFGTVVPKHIASECPPDYLYPHDFPNHWVPQQYLPDDLLGQNLYHPGDNQFERGRAAYWDAVKKNNH